MLFGSHPLKNIVFFLYRPAWKRRRQSWDDLPRCIPRWPGRGRWRCHRPGTGRCRGKPGSRPRTQPPQPGSCYSCLYPGRREGRGETDCCRVPNTHAYPLIHIPWSTTSTSSSQELRPSALNLFKMASFVQMKEIPQVRRKKIIITTIERKTDGCMESLPLSSRWPSTGGRWLPSSAPRRFAPPLRRRTLPPLGAPRPGHWRWTRARTWCSAEEKVKRSVRSVGAVWRHQIWDVALDEKQKRKC